MGYVGLPLALTFVERGKLRVTGFDIDQEKVDSLNAGANYIMYIGRERVGKARTSGLFDATSDMNRLAEPDVLIVAVPTPLTAQQVPDMKYVVSTTEEIRRRLRPGQLVVLESTTYPGTTDELMLAILERDTGLVQGKDFFLAFSPEREDPGNKKFNTATIPKIVGGMDADTTKACANLYKKALDSVVTVSSTRVAEATKLTENIFRSVNIALVNELKIIYDRMGIDVWEVLDAAATKPFGFMKFNPGPGLGGHCIPLDPYYLAWKAREYGLTTRFIELAGQINVNMPTFVIDKLQFALNERHKSVRGTKVLILGLSYKKDIDDPRESPSFTLIDKLHKLGANVEYHDPHIAAMPKTRAWAHLPLLKSQALTPALLEHVDAVIIATDHSAVDYELVAKHANLIIDTRGVYRSPGLSNVVKA
jgi:UDP-N-acetyl-D-glucosamine dehydrogenase